MNDSNLIHDPAIADDDNAKSEYIFGNIRNARAETGNHVHISDGVVAFAIAPPFFEQDENQEYRNGDEQNFAVGFHIATVMA